MSAIYVQTSQLPLPSGYATTQPQNQPFKTNNQFFLSQNPSSIPISISNQDNQKTIRESKVLYNKQEHNHKEKIFSHKSREPVRRALSQSRSTPIKNRRIFQDIDYSINVNDTFIHKHEENDIKHLLQIQLQMAQKKAQAYSGQYQKLLNNLITLIDQKQAQQLILNPQFNDIVFQLRTLDGIDLSEKVSMEKILEQITQIDEKSRFVEVLKQELPQDWKFWVEPLYYNIKKERIQEKNWRSFISQQQQSFIN